MAGNEPHGTVPTIDTTVDNEKYYTLAIAMLEKLVPILGTSSDFNIPKSSAAGAPMVSAVTLWRETITNAFPKNGHGTVAKYLLNYAFGVDFNLNKYVTNPDFLAIKMVNQPELLKRGAQVILDYLLSPMVNKGRPTGTAAKAVENVPRVDQARFKKQLLGRDGSRLENNQLIQNDLRCPVTDRRERKRPGLDDNCLPVRLEAAHIIPHSIYAKPDAKRFINAFSGGTINDDLIGDTKINNSPNGLLLQHDAHQDFDELLWSIQPDSIDKPAGEVVYTAHRIRMTAPGLSFSIPSEGKRLKFYGGNGNNPNPKLCQLHFSVAKILAAIGGGIGEDEDEVEN